MARRELSRAGLLGAGQGWSLAPVAAWLAIEFGPGLHLGEVTHANVGSPERLAFNVIGPAKPRLRGLRS